MFFGEWLLGSNSKPHKAKHASYKPTLPPPQYLKISIFFESSVNQRCHHTQIPLNTIHSGQEKTGQVSNWWRMWVRHLNICMNMCAHEHHPTIRNEGNPAISAAWIEADKIMFNEISLVLKTGIVTPVWLRKSRSCEQKGAYPVQVEGKW